jgi:hypothetical protein
MKRPFWMHQLVEYVLAVGLVFAGAHSPKPAVPAIGGVLVALNAAVVDGPWSAFHGFPRSIHRIFDWVIAVGMLLTGILFSGLFDSASRGLTLMMGFVLAFVAWQSDYTKKPRRSQVSTQGGRHVEVSRLAGRGAAHTINLAKAIKRSRGQAKDDPAER